ncbi:protein cramped-like [Protopterus annectens]|uniref:protein cramped-like n=1 Tax=Protopterus annectens TaxID=7888 RepID=UPI001CFA2263|nr:protein cramped-like [Protopterus annectens]
MIKYFEMQSTQVSVDQKRDYSLLQMGTPTPSPIPLVLEAFQDAFHSTSSAPDFQPPTPKKNRIFRVPDDLKYFYKNLVADPFAVSLFSGVSDEEDQKPVRLPLKVPVELQPRTNHAWARVQSLAQNPRLRMIVELHRKVSGLIEFLKQKWALHEVRVRKTLAERQQQNCRIQLQVLELEEKKDLHLYPAENCTIMALPGVARVVHSKAFCTVHWQETGRCKQSTKDSHLLPPAQLLGIQNTQMAARGHLKNIRSAVDIRCVTGKGEGSTDISRNVSLPVDSSHMAEDNVQETSLSEGALDSIGSSHSSDGTVCRQQNLVENVEHLTDPETLSTGVSLVECSDQEALTPEVAALKDNGSCVCGRLVDPDELSTIDPVPHYMKSCQDLAAPEKCVCLEKEQSTEKDVSDVNSSAVERSGVTEMSGFNSMQLINRVESPNSGTSGCEMQIGDGHGGSHSDICTKEGLVSGSDENCQDRSASLLPQSSQGQSVNKPSKEDSTRLAEQVQEEGWNFRNAENLTLAEVYLMMGRPNKLQLEYDWVQTQRQDVQETGEQLITAECSTVSHKQKLLKSLLQLIATEVNPKPSPETNSVATSPMKTSLEDQNFTPPGKIITVNTRSPSCARSNSSVRSNKAFSPTIGPSGLQNMPRPLVVMGAHSSGNSDADSGVFAIPTTLPPNSRHGKVFSPCKDDELNFRQQLDSLSRTLLPRPSGNSSQHVCSFSILSNPSSTGTGSFRPIQSVSKTAVSRPIIPKAIKTPADDDLSSAVDFAAKTAGIFPNSPLVCAEGSEGITPLSPEPVSSKINTLPIVEQDLAVHLQNGVTSIPSTQDTPVLPLPEPSKSCLENGLSSSSEGTSMGLSPPVVAALLDLSLPGPPEDVLSQGAPVTEISDSIIEIAISSAQYGERGSLSPAKLNGSDSSKSLSSPSTSPQASWIASPTHDPQWYPSDSTDSTLGSLLSSLISPEKSRKTMLVSPGNTSGTSLLGPSLLDGNSRDSFVSRPLVDVGEVDSQLACMMSENSLDYISRFNDLAQELTVSEPSRKEILFDSSGPPVGDLSQ